MDWFLYGRDLHHERVNKGKSENFQTRPQLIFFL